MQSSTRLCFKCFGGVFGLSLFSCLLLLFLFLLLVDLFSCFLLPQSVHHKGNPLINPSYIAFSLAFNYILSFEGSLRDY